MNPLRILTWAHFWRSVLIFSLAIGGFVYAAVLIVDPYDTVFFSPPLNRAPVTTNQRFSYPALARKAKFDSAMVGTSMTRLLKPSDFNRTLGGAFVNLSMNSAMAWEQSQILGLFARHHRRARSVIFGLDGTWCAMGKPPAKLTFRPFPPWMYDENRWNDLLYLFNLKTLEQLGLQVAWLLGDAPPRRGLDGYTDFLPPRTAYDLARARTYIYGRPTPIRRPSVIPPYRPTEAERLGWVYPTHALLRAMLAGLPQKTIKILVFVPYNHYRQPQRGSRAAAQLRECKRRITALAGQFENSHVLDFMIESAITRVDANYWDLLHFDTTVATRLATLIAEGVRQRRGQGDLFRYLSTRDFAE